MSLYQSQKFKQLQKTWYQKLKEDGFEDIEDTTNDKGHLFTWHSAYFHSRYTPDAYAAKQDYYRLADAFNSRYEFESEQQKDIWHLHAEGQSLRNIATTLNISVYHVHKVVKLLTTIMLETR